MKHRILKHLVFKRTKRPFFRMEGIVKFISEGYYQSPYGYVYHGILDGGTVNGRFQVIWHHMDIDEVREYLGKYVAIQGKFQDDDGCVVFYIDFMEEV